MILNYFMELFRRLNKSSCEIEIKEIKYLNNRIETLTRSLSESINPINITIKPQGIVRPYLIDVIRDCEVADLEYCSFSLDEWKIILTDIFNELKPKETYKSRIFDCDDFALVFAGVLAFSAFKSGFTEQPAFAITWSQKHAYNLFITNDNEIYIFEPQTGNIMTWDVANTQDMYKTSKVWFMS